MSLQFKKFVLRGNVVDLAVAIVVGTAFTAVVKALVADLFTPIITINHSHFLYGDFLNAVFTFLTVAAAIFFFVVAPIGALRRAARRPIRTPRSARVRQPDPGQGAALPTLHLDLGRGSAAWSRRLGLRPARTGALVDAGPTGCTEITRPTRPRLNTTVPAACA